MAADRYKYFRPEAREILDGLRKGLLDLEKGADADSIAKLLRLAHTLKGAARVVGKSEIADDAHAIEDLLAPYRERGQTVPREQVDLLLKRTDSIEAHVSALELNPVSKTEPAAKVPAADGLQTVRADVSEMDDLVEGIAEAYSRLAPLRQHLAIVAQARQVADVLSERAGTLYGRGSRSESSSSSEKVKGFASELHQVLSRLEVDLGGSVDQLEQELNHVRTTAEQIRLVRVRSIFTVLERSARDAARSQSKQVAFEGRGGDIRVDSHVLATVQNALIQVIRNAVAHGIELQETRVAKGKDSIGKIVLEVSRRGRFVTFSCADDGAGFNVDAVHDVIRKKGVSTVDLARLAPEALVNKLLEGGISTSDTITDVSGRGIGLNAVREFVESITGTVNIQTTKGQGSRVVITVPILRASFDGLSVTAGDTLAILPLDAVHRAVWLRPTDIADSPTGASIFYEGAAIPYISLANALSVEKSVERSTEEARPAVILKNSDALAAVGMDLLLGVVPVLLKPLPELVPSSTLVAGLAQDSDGNPQIVLDPDGLMGLAAQRHAPQSKTEQARPLILIIDDSLTTRMLEQSILESAGYLVDTAIHAEEGLQKARKTAYALFLVDVEMPGMDGFSFIEQVRSDPSLRHIPSILVTSRSSQADFARADEVGANGYVVKGQFNQNELLKCIRTLVG